MILLVHGVETVSNSCRVLASAGATSFNPHPSDIILEVSEAGILDDSNVETLAKQVLFPTEDNKIWLRHLMTVSENRKKGTQKAAKTRRSKKASQCSQ